MLARATKRIVGTEPAELVARITSSWRAWPPSESRAYIQHWLHGTEVTETAISRVFAAVNKILAAGRVDVAAAVAA